MPYLNALLSHARAVQEAGALLGLAARLPLATLALELEGADGPQCWQPRFVGASGGRLAYTEVATARTIGFAGWMPYPLRQWPAALDKRLFKAQAAAAGVATPAACDDPARIGGPFLVKQAGGSFGEGLRGPFLAYDAAAAAQQLAAGEFYENFVLGHIAKAWCWGAECVALELQPPSLVTGDGRSTLAGLVRAALPGRDDHDWDVVGQLAAYCGVDALDRVLPQGKQVLVEFRYGSRYERQTAHNSNALPALRDTPLGAQFARAAQALAGLAPADPALGPSLYTLDAIIDAEGQAQFLEMNCNPLVHPDAYLSMLRSRCGTTLQ